MMFYNSFYTLDDDGEPVLEPDFNAFCDWLLKEKDKLIMAMTEVHGKTVATVFLGRNYNFTGKVPVLWETKIFDTNDKFINTELCDYGVTRLVRCSGSRADALEMHNKVVKKLRDSNGTEI